MSIAELIERLEAAAGGSWQMDSEIHVAVGGCLHRETHTVYYEEGESSDSTTRCKTCGVDTYGAKVPEYSRSLDAAMTLVPENHTFDICICPEMGSVARIYFGSARENSAGEPTGRGHTPAVSICIAALKARGGDE